MWTPPSFLLPRPLRLLPPALLLVAACALIAFGVAPTPVQAAGSVVGSGTVATDTRRPGEFDAIAVGGGIDLTVRQAATAQLTLSADDNLLPLIETVVEGGTLKIRFARGQSIRTRAPVKVAVDAVRLRAIASSGSGDVKVERFETPALALSLSGSSDAVLDALRTDSLAVDIAGSGDLRAQGSATRLKLSIAGSGEARLAALECDDVEVSIAGSGDVNVFARRSLKVDIAGSGDVSYRGGASQVTSSIAGSGSVSAR
ncbi:MAG: head GIN domain-containing protein [Rubrivivax sp.]